uniref:bacteriocin immunity protein n=1 Tax=Listeria welshimeri TaxID=1643 RepID=UPI00396F43FF
MLTDWPRTIFLLIQQVLLQGQNYQQLTFSLNDNLAFLSFFAELPPQQLALQMQIRPQLHAHL